MAFWVAESHEKLSHMACHQQGIFLERWEVLGHQTLILYSGAHHLAGIGVVLVRHIRLCVVSPMVDGLEVVDIEHSLLGRFEVGAGSLLVTSVEGIIAPESTLSHGIGHDSTFAVDSKNAHPDLGYRHLVPHRRQVCRRFVGAVGQLVRALSVDLLDDKLVRLCSFDGLEIKGGRVGELVGKAVPVGIAPIASRPYRLEILLLGLLVDLIIIDVMDVSCCLNGYQSA